LEDVGAARDRAIRKQLIIELLEIGVFDRRYQERTGADRSAYAAEELFAAFEIDCTSTDSVPKRGAIR